MHTEDDRGDAALSSMQNPAPPSHGGGDEAPPAKKKNPAFCASLKMFIAALSFTYFAKAFSGSYMKSSITQIERRFDIPSAIVGIIDGSFEMGNLLLIPFVSYFGAKWHRPKLIAAGCLTMSIGSFLTALPHFFMGYYTYDTTVNYDTSRTNSTSIVVPCLDAQMQHNISHEPELTSGMNNLDCEKVAGSNIWIYVLLGNLLRGIGETPITPLGISYLDDFSKPENTAFYIACIHTVSIIGPVLGFMLGSLCANLYVDIGFVDIDSITITPQDSRWVGAWWLGFLIAGTVTLFSAIPFCFLPKSLINEAEETRGTNQHEDCIVQEGEPLNTDGVHQEQVITSVGTTGFLKDLKRLFCNPVFTLFMALCLLQFGSFVGYSTYKPKYMQQQFGQSISKSNFLTGVTAWPALAVGVFFGGFILKKCKLNLLGIAQFAIVSSIVANLLTLSFFAMACKNVDVAGLTVTYNGNNLANIEESSLVHSCNSDCNCKANQWDPVCGDNGLTYTSSCLAGCTLSSGSGRNTAFHNCTCIEATGFQSQNYSVTLGECPKEEDCSTKFIYFLIIDVISSFIYAVGGTPAYMIVFRSVDPELKSLSVGVYTLVMRTLAGIPAPVYFGALIDKTCLMWGSKICGGQGACRIYNASSYRKVFLGLTAGMRGLSSVLSILLIIMLTRRFRARKDKVTDHDRGGGHDQYEGRRPEGIDSVQTPPHQETPF
ncbi:solute carrier organic anion transporter family member 1B3-like [Ambystoma mexicanum]|uniref:solute carrier organic anion transporter family member 1B3-like n=1 Tax=Ambystoma mexicanum TaxID=8296 RepID=UPI0037E88F5D